MVSNFNPQVYVWWLQVHTLGFSGFASGAGPVLADEGKQNPEAAEEMMVAEIRYDDCGGRLFVKV